MTNVSDILRFPIGGYPLLMYGMIAVTTGIIAYATITSDLVQDAVTSSSSSSSSSTEEPKKEEEEPKKEAEEEPKKEGEGVGGILGNLAEAVGLKKEGEGEKEGEEKAALQTGGKNKKHRKKHLKKTKKRSTRSKTARSKTARSKTARRSS